MKIAMLWLLAFVMLFLAGCGDKNDADPETNPVSTSDSPVHTDTTAALSPDGLGYRFEEYILGISFSVPRNYIRTSQGSSAFFREPEQGAHFIVLCYESTEQPLSLEKITDFLFPKLCVSASSLFLLGDAKEITPLASRAITNNGLEYWHFEGTITYSDFRDEALTRKGFVVGCNFLIDNEACQLLIASNSSEDTPEKKDDMRAQLDAIIQTLSRDV